MAESRNSYMNHFGEGHMYLKGTEILAPAESVYYDESLAVGAIDFFDLEHK